MVEEYDTTWRTDNGTLAIDYDANAHYRWSATLNGTVRGELATARITAHSWRHMESGIVRLLHHAANGPLTLHFTEAARRACERGGNRNGN